MERGLAGLKADPFGVSRPLLSDGGFLIACEAALNHAVVGVVDLGSGHFLGFLRCAGFDFYDDALVVESDYFDSPELEGVVGVERGGCDVHYVCHNC